VRVDHPAVVPLGTCLPVGNVVGLEGLVRFAKAHPPAAEVRCSEEPLCLLPSVPKTNGGVVADPDTPSLLAAHDYPRAAMLADPDAEGGCGLVKMGTRRKRTHDQIGEAHRGHLALFGSSIACAVVLRG
jgi:hypothetical protein